MHESDPEILVVEHSSVAVKEPAKEDVKERKPSTTVNEQMQATAKVLFCFVCVDFLSPCHSNRGSWLSKQMNGKTHVRDGLTSQSRENVAVASSIQFFLFPSLFFFFCASYAVLFPSPTD